MCIDVRAGNDNTKGRHKLEREMRGIRRFGRGKGSYNLKEICFYYYLLLIVCACVNAHSHVHTSMRECRDPWGLELELQAVTRQGF